MLDRWTNFNLIQLEDISKDEQNLLDVMTARLHHMQVIYKLFGLFCNFLKYFLIRILIRTLMSTTKKLVLDGIKSSSIVS